MKLSIQDIEKAIEAKKHGVPPSVSIENISIDSRSLQNNSDTLFFALKGNNHNAHNYIESLIAKGVCCFVVESVPEKLLHKAFFLEVANTLSALQQVAVFYRKQFHIPTIGITGSNGKTIVKEWLNFLLSKEHTIVRSPKSYNSQVGVPLSVFGINENHTFAIFEAGISTRNEMENLQKIILPTIGIFTHLGDAHKEGFDSENEKIIEKTKLFSQCEIVILEKNKKIEEYLPNKTFTWSFTDKNATVFATKSSVTNALTLVNIEYKKHNTTIEIPFLDEASLANAMTCICTLLYLDYDLETIVARIKELYPIELRLQVKKGINNCSLIEDCYSSDYASLQLAFDFLEQQKMHPKKSVILSDIFASGLPLETLYKNVVTLLKNNNINRIIAIGETIGKHLKGLPNAIFFNSTQDFLQQFNTNSFANETILIKGARNFHFEEIVVLLEEKNHETVLEINLDAITDNLNFYKAKLHPKTKIMAMVKAFGYGNGGFEIAKLLEHHQIDYLGVAFADEGIALRKAGITLPIMVLNPEKSSFHAMIAYQLEPEIYSISGLLAFLKTAKQSNISSYPIHLKIDTGMHRLGFVPADLEELKTLITNNNFIVVKSIFTHLAASDTIENKAFTLQQISLFTECYNNILNVLHHQPIRHILNTSGIFNYPNYQMEMVRLGIGLYGIGNSEEENQQLQRVSTLKSVISQIRMVAAGESIGYSRSFIAKKPTKMATIPIGYADGIPRLWGNEKGYVTIQNKKARILGSVCMDMLMVDVTKIDCKEGDWVIVFGEQPTVLEIANATQTIAYEILVGISQRVKRVYYKG